MSMKVESEGAVLRAYKVLSSGKSGFTGSRWPLPEAGEPGPWISVSGPLGLCVNGIHASTVEQLPQWLGDEIWEAELGGEVLKTEPALVAARARLVGQVSEWDEAAQIAFCRDCAERAEMIAARYPPGAAVLTGVIEPCTDRGMAAAVGYWAALLAGESASARRAGAEYDAAFARERAAQAIWLRRELRLGD